MPCLLGCLALSTPRVVLFCVWLFSDYLNEAYRTNFWPFVGFLFMPLTTLAYAFAWHQGGGTITNAGIVVMVVAVVIDLGLFGTGARARKRRTIVVKGERVG